MPPAGAKRSFASPLFCGLGVLLCACTGVRAPRPAGTPVATPPPAAAAPVDDKQAKEPKLTPERKRGWTEVAASLRPRIDALAGDYAAYLANAKTPRRAVTGLIALAQAAGARPLAEGPRPAPGSLHYLVSPGGDAVALLRVGRQPIEDGVRMVVSGVDAPRLVAKQNPVSARAGLILFETTVHGAVDLKSWLSQPLALYLHAARPGQAGATAIDVVIGEAEGDPVLVVPDLLPHLSGKLQSAKIVDSPERMDALVARSRNDLAQFLRSHGLDEAALADAEVALVPAGPPTFIGVDRALLAGYGHSHRALTWAAARALVEGEAPARTALVIAIAQGEANYGGDSGAAFASIALSRAIEALAEAGPATDTLAVRRIHQRSAALVATRGAGELNSGLVLSPGIDDSLPAARRRALDVLDRAGVQWQFGGDEAEWTSPARRLASLDLDVVAVGLPTTGHGAPLELASILDLYQGYLACRAWLSGS